MTKSDKVKYHLSYKGWKKRRQALFSYTFFPHFIPFSLARRLKWTKECQGTDKIEHFLEFNYCVNHWSIHKILECLPRSQINNNIHNLALSHADSISGAINLMKYCSVKDAGHKQKWKKDRYNGWNCDKDVE